MSFSPYLNFRGTCREAMTTYADIFGATDLQIMPFSDMPPDAAPPGTNPDLVMHSQFSAGPGAPLLASDVPDHWEMATQNATVFHGATDAARAQAVFDRLAAGGSVTMPLGPTFWSPAFGMLTDKFGTSWMISVAAPT
jgi:PhnB protein